jgi:hypothetical protein
MPGTHVGCGGVAGPARVIFRIAATRMTGVVSATEARRGFSALRHTLAETTTRVPL